MCECMKCCLVSCLVGIMVGGAIVVSNKKIEKLLKKGKDFASEKIQDMTKGMPSSEINE